MPPGADALGDFRFGAVAARRQSRSQRATGIFPAGQLMRLLHVSLVDELLFLPGTLSNVFGTISFPRNDPGLPPFYRVYAYVNK
jgi:hypothetical protein